MGVVALLYQASHQPRVERSQPGEGCEHVNCSGVDERPVDDPRKVWHCEQCGFLFRYITRAAKPWFIEGHAPVEVVS